MNITDFKTSIELAREFECELEFMKRKIFEPTELGNGKDTDRALRFAKENATKLMEDVVSTVDRCREDLRVFNENSSAIAEWSDELSDELDRLENIGFQNGFTCDENVGEDLENSYGDTTP